jgi:hypothetical protein
MRSRRGWIGLWAAVSALWILYWFGLTASLGAEAIRDLVGELPAQVVVGALCLFLPVGLFAAGSLVAWINSRAGVRA